MPSFIHNSRLLITLSPIFLKQKIVQWSFTDVISCVSRRKVSHDDKSNLHRWLSTDVFRCLPTSWWIHHSYASSAGKRVAWGCWTKKQVDLVPALRHTNDTHLESRIHRNNCWISERQKCFCHPRWPRVLRSVLRKGMFFVLRSKQPTISLGNMTIRRWKISRSSAYRHVKANNVLEDKMFNVRWYVHHGKWWSVMNLCRFPEVIFRLLKRWQRSKSPKMRKEKRNHHQRITLRVHRRN